MAFSLTATVGSTTLNLANKSPYRLLHVTGASGVPVRRVVERGPAQVGDTDVGFRLSPRIIELAIGFYATTDAILDGYRDGLTQFFKPLTSTPVKLTFTRDDGAVRQIDCYTIDEIKIDLLKENRPGHYHNATVRLQAPDPAFYNPVPGTVAGTATAGTATDWYLAGGAIGTAQVLMQGGTPAQGGTWSYNGTVTSSYTLAIRSAQEVFGTAKKYAFDVSNNASWYRQSLYVQQNGLDSLYGACEGSAFATTLGTSFMPAGTSNYFLRYDPSVDFAGDGFHHAAFQAGTVGSVPVLTAWAGGNDLSIRGTTRRWRSDYGNNASSRWSNPLLLYALYSPALTNAQIAALDVFMAGSVGGTAAIGIGIPYVGNLAEYPVIRITGPITNAGILNSSTNDRIDFGTNTIGAGTTLVIDTRPGIKSVLEGTISRRSYLGAGSDIDTFHLTPDEVVNVVYFYGTNTNGSTSMSIVYYNRYTSY